MIILTIALTILYMAIGLAVIMAWVLAAYQETLTKLGISEDEEFGFAVMAAVYVTAAAVFWPVVVVVAWFVRYRLHV